MLNHVMVGSNNIAKSKEFYGDTSTLVYNAAINPYFGPSMGISDEAVEKTRSGSVITFPAPIKNVKRY